MTQSHWFRLEDGRIIDHWANRDDLGMARQLGWIPPSPAFLFKMARPVQNGPRQAPRPPHPSPLTLLRPTLLCPDPRAARASRAPSLLRPTLPRSNLRYCCAPKHRTQ